MQVADLKAALNTYLISIGLVVLISTFQTQLAIVEQWRLDWVETLPLVENDFWGWFSSLWPLALILTSAFLLNELWQSAKQKQVSNQVIERDYHKATYKLIPKEEYDKLPKAIPEAMRKEVIERDGLKCRYTGKKVYLEPPNKYLRQIWKATKDSKSVGFRVISLMVDRQMLDIDHVIPRRLGGPTKPANLVVAAAGYNRGMGYKIKGKKRRLVMVKLLESGETIHKDCL